MIEEPEPPGELSIRTPVRGWRAAFPPAQWLAAYRPQWLPRDAIAGVTLAAYGIPVSLAYASLAGLPPQYGIYCYLVGGLFYALFGSSRQLAIGPTSAISMLVGVTVAGMANGDPTRWADIAALTALVIAAMCVLAWVLRLSSLVNFISETILLGFKAGAALTIAMTQLPKLFGVKGGGEDFFERIVVLWGQLPETNLAVLAFGLVALAVLLLGEKFLPGRPIALLVVVASIIVLSVTPLADLGFKIVGALPTGLPAFHLPGLRVRDVDGVIPLAFACLLLAYVESVSAARALAQAHGDEVDPRQELLGLGAANLGAALFQAYPVAGGLSQSSVNDKAGAKTPLALVFASVTIAICLLYLTGLLSQPAQRGARRHRAGGRQGIDQHHRTTARMARESLRIQRIDGRLRRRAAAGHSPGCDRGGPGVAPLADTPRRAPACGLPRQHPRHPRFTPTSSAIRTTRPFPVCWCSVSRRRCCISTSSMCAMPYGRRSAPPPDR